MFKMFAKIYSKVNDTFTYFKNLFQFYSNLRMSVTQIFENIEHMQIKIDSFDKKLINVSNDKYKRYQSIIQNDNRDDEQIDNDKRIDDVMKNYFKTYLNE